MLMQPQEEKSWQSHLTDNNQAHDGISLISTTKNESTKMNSSYTATKNSTLKSIGKRSPTDKALNSSLDISPRSSACLKANNRAAPSQSGKTPVRRSWHRKQSWRVEHPFYVLPTYVRTLNKVIRRSPAAEGVWCGLRGCDCRSGRGPVKTLSGLGHQAWED